MNNMALSYDITYKTKRKTDTYTCTTLSKVNESIERHNFDGDHYEYATFKYGNINYLIHESGVLYKILKNGSKKEVTGNPIAENRYRRVVFRDKSYIGKINSHVLVLNCLYDNFFDYYMQDSELVVNHCVITDDGKVKVPLPETLTDLRYLEVITQRDNLRHGRFVHEYELYDLYVSALDIDDIYKLFKKCEELFGSFGEDTKNQVMRECVKQYYKIKGVQFKVDFKEEI